MSCAAPPACVTLLLADPSPPRAFYCGLLAPQGLRLPLDYRAQEVDAATAAKAVAAAEARAGGGAAPRLRRYVPPASTDPDAYTVVKFYALDDAMLHCSELCFGAAAAPRALRSAVHGAVPAARGCNHRSPQVCPPHPGPLPLFFPSPSPSLSVMTNEGQADVDFKFRVSPAEAVRGSRCALLGLPF